MLYAHRKNYHKYILSLELVIFKSSETHHNTSYNMKVSQECKKLELS